MFGLKWLVDHGAIPKDRLPEYYSSYLAGLFRTMRFGTAEAHGKAEMMEFNYLFEQKAIQRDAAGKYVIDYARTATAIAALAKELLEMEATGDRARAESWFAKYDVMPAELKAALAHRRRCAGGHHAQLLVSAAGGMMGWDHKERRYFDRVAFPRRPTCLSRMIRAIASGAFACSGAAASCSRPTADFPPPKFSPSPSLASATASTAGPGRAALYQLRRQCRLRVPGAGARCRGRNRRPDRQVFRLPAPQIIAVPSTRHQRYSIPVLGNA